MSSFARVWFLATLLVLGTAVSPVAAASANGGGGGCRGQSGCSMFETAGTNCCSVEADSAAPGCGAASAAGADAAVNAGGHDHRSSGSDCSDDGDCDCSCCPGKQAGQAPAASVPAAAFVGVLAVTTVDCQIIAWRPRDSWMDLLRPPRG